MKTTHAEAIGTFAAGTGAILATALASRVCPGTCTNCATCVSSVAPVAAAVSALGASAVLRTVVRRKRAAGA